MSSTIEHDLHSFATQLLERVGGIVDWPEPQSPGTVMVPSELVGATSLPSEEFSVATSAATGGLQVSLASEFLDIAGKMLTEFVPSHGAFQVGERYLKKRDLQEAVQSGFGWQNTRVFCGDPVNGLADYHFWTLLARIQSDDAWETTLQLAVNSHTGVLLDLPEPTQLDDLKEVGERAEFSAVPQGPDTEELVLKLAKDRMFVAATDFIARSEQRLARERRRLQDYYRSLGQEAKPKPRKGVEPPSEDEVAAKLRAVDLELRRKLGELAERYVMRAELHPLVLFRVAIPVVKVPITVQRKQATRQVTAYWNSILKKFEPFACGICSAPIYNVYFTNETVEPRCLACFETKNAAPSHAHAARLSSGSYADK